MKTCDGCGSTDFISNASSENVCKNCGLVGEGVVFSEATTRVFDSEDIKKKVHQESTRGGLGSFLSSNNKSNMKRLSRIQRSVKNDHESRTKDKTKKIDTIKKDFTFASKKIKLTAPQDSYIRQNVLATCMNSSDILKRITRENKLEYVAGMLLVGCEMQNLTHDANNISRILFPKKNSAMTYSKRSPYIPIKDNILELKNNVKNVTNIKTNVLKIIDLIKNYPELDQFKNVFVDKMDLLNDNVSKSILKIIQANTEQLHNCITSWKKRKINDLKSLRSHLAGVINDGNQIEKRIKVITDIMNQFKEFDNIREILIAVPVSRIEIITEECRSAIDILNTTFSKTKTFQFSNISTHARTIKKFIAPPVQIGSVTNPTETLDNARERNLNDLLIKLRVQKTELVRKTSSIIMNAIKNNLMNKRMIKVTAVSTWIALHYHDIMIPTTKDEKMYERFQRIANISDPTLRDFVSRIETMCGIVILDFPKKIEYIMKKLDATNESELWKNPFVRGRIYISNITPIGKDMLNTIKGSMTDQMEYMKTNDIKNLIANRLFTLIQNHESHILEVFVPLFVLWKFPSTPLTMHDIKTKCGNIYLTWEGRYLKTVLDLPFVKSVQDGWQVDSDNERLFHEVMIPFVQEGSRLINAGVTSATVTNSINKIRNSLFKIDGVVPTRQRSIPSKFIDWNDPITRNIFITSKPVYVQAIYRKLKGEDITIGKFMLDYLQNEFKIVGISPKSLTMGSMWGLMKSDPNRVGYYKEGIPVASHWKNKSLEEFVAFHNILNLL